MATFWKDAAVEVFPNTSSGQVAAQQRAGDLARDQSVTLVAISGTFVWQNHLDPAAPPNHRTQSGKNVLLVISKR